MLLMNGWLDSAFYWNLLVKNSYKETITAILKQELTSLFNRQDHSYKYNIYNFHKSYGNAG